MIYHRDIRSYTDFISVVHRVDHPAQAAEIMGQFQREKPALYASYLQDLRKEQRKTAYMGYVPRRTIFD